MIPGSKVILKNILIINADKLNFIDSKDDLGAVIEMIDAELNGLYSNL